MKGWGSSLLSRVPGESLVPCPQTLSQVAHDPSLSIVAVTSILCFVVVSTLKSVTAREYTNNGFSQYKWLRRTILIWGKGKVLSPDATDSGIFLNLMLADLVQAPGSYSWILP